MSIKIEKSSKFYEHSKFMKIIDNFIFTITSTPKFNSIWNFWHSVTCLILSSKLSANNKFSWKFKFLKQLSTEIFFFKIKKCWSSHKLNKFNFIFQGNKLFNNLQANHRAPLATEASRCCWHFTFIPSRALSFSTLFSFIVQVD